MALDSLVERYEALRRDVDVETPEARSVSIRLPVQYVALAQSVADHYGISRAGFIQDLLKDAMGDFLDQLPSGGRMSIAESADKLYKKDLLQFSPDLDLNLPDALFWVPIAQAIERKETTA